MTKKDYILIANALRESLENSTFKSIVYNIEKALKSDNPRFDRDKFIDYIFQGTKHDSI